MKIVAGIYGSRQIARPLSGAVRPLAEKVRAAIFDSLGDISGLTVADLYAGSGAAGLEALSRGAGAVTFVEQDKRVVEVIRANIRSLEAAGTRVINQNVSTWVHSPEVGEYDLVIADPPYAKIDFAVLAKVAAHINAGGILVVSHSSKIEPPVLESMELRRSKRYGDSHLSTYQRITS